MRKIYKINKTSYGVWHEFALNFLFGIIFFAIGIYESLDSIFIGAIILIIAFKFFLYRLSDFLFTKEIIQSDIYLFIRVFFIRLKIESARCYTVIESYSFPSMAGTRYYYLELVRNDKNRWHRLFKNKIKLYPQDGKIDLVGVGQKIEESFGIPFRGIDMSWDGGSYSDDISVLMPNKGIIP